MYVRVDGIHVHICAVLVSECVRRVIHVHAVWVSVMHLVVECTCAGCRILIGGGRMVSVHNQHNRVYVVGANHLLWV